jgi:hypothetical protein
MDPTRYTALPIPSDDPDQPHNTPTSRYVVHLMCKDSVISRRGRCLARLFQGGENEILTTEGMRGTTSAMDGFRRPAMDRAGRCHVILHSSAPDAHRALRPNISKLTPDASDQIHEFPPLTFPLAQIEDGRTKHVCMRTVGLVGLPVETVSVMNAQPTPHSVGT